MFRHNARVLLERIEVLELQARALITMSDYALKSLAILDRRISLTQKALDEALEVLSEIPKDDHNPSGRVHKR